MADGGDADLVAALGATYGLVARIFGAEVDASFYAALRLSPEPTQLDFFGEQPRETNADPADTLERLATEYCRLFIGPRPRCVPYGSVRQGEAGLRGKTEQRVLQFADKAGIELTLASPVIAADHVAVAFEILSQLYSRATTSEHREPELALADEFIEASVFPWIPEFLDEVRSETMVPLYRTAAELGLSLLRHPRAQRDGIPR